MAAITGRRAQVRLAATTGSSAAVAVGESVEYSLETDQGLEEVSALGSTWAVHVLSGAKKWSGSLRGNFNTASAALWDSAVLDKVCRLYLYPHTDATSEYFEGTAWVKLGTVIAGGMTAAPKTAVQFTGDSDLTYNN